MPKKFLCLQRSVPVPEGVESPSPAQMQEMYARFGEWQKKWTQHVVDMGGGLGESRLATDGPLDGPVVEVKELAGGYMVIQADTFEQAIEIASDCPGLVRPGSAVELIEIEQP